MVTRLCEPIDGIDAVQIAEFLGINLNLFMFSEMFLRHCIPNFY